MIFVLVVIYQFVFIGVQIYGISIMDIEQRKENQYEADRRHVPLSRMRVRPPRHGGLPAPLIER